MREVISCISYKGEGKVLKKLKEKTKRLFRENKSFIRVSTCQRIEIYSDNPLSKINRMNSLMDLGAMQHLIEVMSGIDSGLFGEIEIYLQIMDSLETAKKENHLSQNLEKFFSIASKISEKIRDIHGLNNSWIKSVRKEIEGNKKILISGEGNLAKALASSLSKEFLITRNSEEADSVIILKKGFHFENLNSDAKIINLTEEESEEDEMKLKEFFTKPEEKFVNQIEDDIRNELEKSFIKNATPSATVG